LYLVRHGETEYNVSRRMQGHSEVPLNDRGIAQAAALGRRLASGRLDHIYASDLRRATMTAGIVAALTGAPITYEAAFRERDPGPHLTGKSYDETLPFFTDWGYAPPEGETFEVFGARVRSAFTRLAEEEAGKGRHVAVVTHGMVCGAFLRVFFDMTQEEIFALRWPNASVSVLEYDGGWRIERLGDDSHLDGLAGDAALPGA
jgi:broad specificity phosphatase PhoE